MKHVIKTLLVSILLLPVGFVVSLLFGVTWQVNRTCSSYLATAMIMVAALLWSVKVKFSGRK